MTANDVITQCDRLKPNSYSCDQKMKWLKKIESDIINHQNKYSPVKRTSEFDKASNPDLSLTESEINIYIFYLISMIDISNQEYDLYNNSSSFFNYEFSKWKKEFRQRQLPLCNITIKV